MKTLLIIILLFFCFGCTSSILTAYGLRSLDTHYGIQCVKIGYTKMTDEWRECIMDHRNSRPGVTNEQLSRQISRNNFMQRHRTNAARHHARGMCAVNGTC